MREAKASLPTTCSLFIGMKTNIDYLVELKKTNIGGQMTVKEMLIGGQDGVTVIMDAAMGNRHGMISGATGTGKAHEKITERIEKIQILVKLVEVDGLVDVLMLEVLL